MRAKTAALILSLCILLTSLAACGGGSAKTLRLPLSVLPECFDPQISSGIDSENIINNCFEGLVRIDSAGNIAKGVAKNWSVSSDGLTYTFKLRTDAKWFVPRDAESILGEDYEKTFDARVTAHDFEFALKRAVDPATGAPLANTLVSIKGAESILDGNASPDTLGVSATDDYTLEIRLSKPSVSFLSVLASPVCMPCNEEFFNATAGRYGLKVGLILCNGPYYLALFDEENGVTLKDNEEYSGEYKPLADVAKFIFPASLVQTSSSDKDSDSTESTTSAAQLAELIALEEGGFHVGNVTNEESKSLKDVAEIQKYKNSLKLLCFNSSSDVLKDQNVRLAMIHATNIDLLRGNNPDAEGVVPSCCGLAPGVSYRAGSNIIATPGFDLSKAYACVSAALPNCGVEDGALNLSVNFICLKEDETAVKEILQDWQKVFGVGLSVTVTPYDTQEKLDAAVSQKAYDIAYTKITASEFLAADFLNRFSSKSGTNIIGISSAKYDSLLENIYNAPDEAALLAANKQAEEFLVSGGYLLPIYECNSYLAVKSTAKGLTVRPSGTVYALYE